LGKYRNEKEKKILLEIMNTEMRGMKLRTSLITQFQKIKRINNRFKTLTILKDK
jgi:hypothetical protein